MELKVFYHRYHLHVVPNLLDQNFNSDTPSKKWDGDITYGGRVYLSDLYWKICKLLEVGIQPVYGPEKPGDVKHSNADISKAKNILGYNTEYDVDRGLEKAIDGIRRICRDQRIEM